MTTARWSLLVPPDSSFFLSLWLVGLHHAYSPFRLHIVQLLQGGTFMGCYTRKELMKDLNPAAWLVPDLQWAPSACFGQKLLDTMRWHADLMSFSQTCASTPLFSWRQPENTQNWQLCYWHPDLIADSKFTLSMCDRCERVCRDRRWDNHPAWPVWQWVNDGPGRCIILFIFFRLHLFLVLFPIFMTHWKTSTIVFNQFHAKRG